MEACILQGVQIWIASRSLINYEVRNISLDSYILILISRSLSEVSESFISLGIYPQNQIAARICPANMYFVQRSCAVHIVVM